MIDYSLLRAFDDGNPIRQQYFQSIQKAQNGGYDYPLKQMRFYGLHQLVERGVRNHPALDVAECGCFHGHSSHLTASVLAQSGFGGRFAIFDSFEGLSEFGAEDVSSYSETPEKQEALRAHFRSSREHVAGLLEPFPFATLFPGWIPERFAEVADWSFSHVTVDVDLYQPTKDALLFFYPRLVDGGSMYLDDFGYADYPGARRATEEFLATVRPTLFVEMPYGSAILIK